MNATYLEKIESFAISNKYLILIIIGLFIIRLPSLLEPLWYGDEAIYVAIGQEINRGSLLYTDIFDHKTPGIYYLAAWSMKLLGETIWSFKFLLAVWLIPTVIAFFYLTKTLFSKKAALLATFALALFISTPAFEGNIVNSEILMILPISVALILGFKKRFLYAGIFFSLALLLKFPAIFDFGAFFIFVALTLDQKKYKETIKHLVLLTLGLAIPFGLTFVYFAFKGALPDYVNTAFLFNVTYTNYGNEFIIPNGLLILKAFPIFAVFVYSLWRVFSKKGRDFGSRLGKIEFLLIWLVFSFYGAVFGGRNYIHYMIQPIVPLSILIAVTTTSKNLRRVGLSTIGLVIILSLALGFTPNIRFSYYTNFVRFATNNISPEEYQSSFDPNTSRNYSIASLINKCSEARITKECNTTKDEPDDTVYVWANQPAIYFLSRVKPASKYITAFHVLGSDDAKKEVIQDLRKNSPKYIIIDEDGPLPFQKLDSFVRSRYNLFAISENFNIYELNQGTSSR